VIDVAVTRRGARRRAAGHPWIYRSDVADEPPGAVAGLARVLDPRGHVLGPALYSPASEIRLRMLDRGEVDIDEAWWRSAIARAAARRHDIDGDAYRVVHAEGDGLPSLVVDRYGPVLSVQLLSAGLEAVRSDVLAALVAVLEPGGVILRNDVPVREREKLPRLVETAWGEVPASVDVTVDGVRLRVDVGEGQKTGGFLDQRENRVLAGRVGRGQALDAFCYEGGFALQLAGSCERVLAVDQSARALERVAENAALNGHANIETVEANAFDLLRDLEKEGRRFDTIVLDPPAFAKHRRALERALAGYKELNLRAMALLAPGGRLLTFSCSYHVSAGAFEDMLREAASDSGRRVVLERRLVASRDHPSVLTIPETSYLKGVLACVDDG